MDFEKYGIPGVIATVAIATISWCVVFIKGLLKEHKEERESIERNNRAERDDWKRTIERQNEESNRNIKENTNVLSGLKTLLENRR